MTDQLSLTIFNTGTLDAHDVPFVSAAGEIERVDATFSSCCYLIRHPRGVLLWDTGLPDSLATEERRVLPPSWRPVVTTTLRAALASVGLEPRAITHLGFSHLHIDHAGNANDFPEATVLLHQHEFETAFNPHPPVAYRSDSYAGLRRNQIVQLTGDHDVFGDGSVVTVETPGHSPGHQSLLIELPVTGAVILAGDLYYAQADRVTRRMPGWNSDRAATFRSMDRIEQIAAETHAIILLGHDAAQAAALPRPPHFLS
ncbi:MAG TPA: N-acyl homoserine lactonase family protein [Thermomicrobiales bacterium]|nr:N-acyl homoserine lactonase family protein [Thermomicrobiales bacterium]